MESKLNAYPNVAALLADWPGAATVFMRYRMACVGCGMARFETLDEVIAIYGLCPQAFKEELIRIRREQMQKDNRKGESS